MSALRLRCLGFVVVAFVLQTVFLRAASPGLDAAPTRSSLAGQLLVAVPDTGDPRFEHAVILLVQDGPGGAFGVVINKPIGEQPFAEVLKALGEDDSDATGSVRIYSGGPVQPEAGFVIHNADYRRPETFVITDRLSITGGLGILRDMGKGKGPSKALVAFGYAGWSPGQLEHEINLGAWATAEADPALIFDEDRDNVWDLAWKRRTEHS